MGCADSTTYKEIHVNYDDIFRVMFRKMLSRRWMIDQINLQNNW